MKRQGVLPLSPGWDANPSKGYRPAFHQASLTIRRTHLYSWEERDGTHLYSWVERDTVKVNHFTQEHNRMTQLGLEPRPPRPGVHCTNHYATATRGPLPPLPAKAL